MGERGALCADGIPTMVAGRLVHPEVPGRLAGRHIHLRVPGKLAGRHIHHLGYREASREAYTPP